MAELPNEKNLKETSEEIGFIRDAIRSIGIEISEVLNDRLDDTLSLTERIGERIRKVTAKDATKSVLDLVKGLDQVLSVQSKIFDGTLKQKDLDKQRQDLIRREASLNSQLSTLANIYPEKRQEILESEGKIKEQLENQIAALNKQEEQYKNIRKNVGFTGNLIKGLNKIPILGDLLGTEQALKAVNAKASELGEKTNRTKVAWVGLKEMSKSVLENDIAALAIWGLLLKGIMASDQAITNIERNLGLSRTTATDLQKSFAKQAADSEKLFINSLDLNKSFNELSAELGFVADLGGESLITYTALTKQLGLGTKEAAQLTTLARLQGKNTEEILANTVDTVSKLNQQNKIGIDAKSILKEISTTSKSIVLSLGQNPQLLAEAVYQARLLGVSLSEVDKIADSLLNFEQSISNELEAELITGKQLNLEQARLFAINNDLAGVAKEINKQGIDALSFSQSNRIQQEAIAKAVGMSKDELANSLYQQELLILGAEQFKEQYGEAAYNQMQAQSAAEQFKETLTKVQSIVGDIGLAFMPILNILGNIVAAIASSKTGIMGLTIAMGALATKSLVTAIANIVGSSMALGPLLGISVAGGIIAAMYSNINSAKQKVSDGIAPSDKGPFTVTDKFGATAVTAKGDNVIVSPNVQTQSSLSSTSTNNASQNTINPNIDLSPLLNEMKSMKEILGKILNKEGYVYLDSTKVGNAQMIGSYTIQ